MIKCKDCKFAIDPPFANSYDEKTLYCSHPKLQNNMYYPGISDDYAKYYYDEGVGIVVGGEFGCIHGKKRT